ncbi:MAG: cytochrome c3 family protein [Melioribacteraceae bacterium]
MRKITSVLFLTAIFFTSAFAQSKDDQVCLDCHSDKTLTTTRNGKQVSLFINGKSFAGSIHEEISCTGCHSDVDPSNLPHPEKLNKVNCATCHETPVAHYERSLHAEALKKGLTLAPTCVSCHSKHEILSSKNLNSKTYVMNIPSLCGQCHKEGTQVSTLVNPDERKVLSDYSESIHGEGLFKRGLIVTAVCTSCHTSHDILPHTNSVSTINRNNITTTCTQCHRQIEQVHIKVIRGALWEKQPHKIPVCIDCHAPHKVRKVFYDDSFPDDKCMKCHGQKELTKIVDGKPVSLYVNYDQFKNSAHTNNSCIKCHTNISNSKKPVCLNSGKVDCSICHTAQVDDYNISLHGQKHYQGDKTAPYCVDCHTSHNAQSKKSTTSPTFARNVPELCGKCHREGKNIATALDESKLGIVANYRESIHGKGLLQSGLLVTATCVNCHSSHRELPKKDPRSTVNPNNIATTCAQCHLGVYEEFKSSIHSPDVTKTDQKLPVCNDCHRSHEINRVDLNDFRTQIINQCGKCHEKVSETYFDTFHGKVSKLGSIRAARCYDCHGAHNILPASNPKSKLSHNNIIETCQTCHPNSNRKFVGYLTHATHHNRDKYPYLYYTFWAMVFLLVGTFSFFGIHTIMWFTKSLKEKKRHKIEKKKVIENAQTIEEDYERHD